MKVLASRVAWGLVLAFVCIGAVAQESAVQVKLDHVPIAVQDLGAATETYRDRLGFRIKPGRLHENSIDNMHIKFPDGSALELITSARPEDALAARYLRFLEGGDGPAFLALHGGPVDTLAKRLQGLEVSFNLAHGSYVNGLDFDPAGPLGYLFFADVHRPRPDLPEHYAHPNTATHLSAVWLAASDFNAEVALLEKLGIDTAGQEIPLDPLETKARRVVLGQVALYLLPAEAQSVAGRKIVGVTVAVRDIHKARTYVEKATGRSTTLYKHEQGQSIFLPPSAANGLWIEFFMR